MQAEPVTTQALIDAVDARTADAQALTRLHIAIEVAAATAGAADAMVDHFVAAARAGGSSWTEIGDRLGVTRQAARQRFALPAPTARGGAGDGLPVEPRLAACLEVAYAAAAGQDSVPGTQHLLLGLLHAGVAANALGRLGVGPERVREASDRLLSPAQVAGRRMVGDGQAEAALAGARRLAADRGQNQLRGEHVLFVIGVDPGSSARRVLTDLGVSAAAVKKEIEACVGAPPRRRRRFARDQRVCGFCGCADADRPMVAGPGVFICAPCVALCAEILEREARAA